jgi:hypothetical protein
MQKTESYKKCVLDARAHERGDGQGWVAEIYVLRLTSLGVVDNQFMLKESFPNAEAAIEAALQTGRGTVDAEIESTMEQASAQ